MRLFPRPAFAATSGRRTYREFSGAIRVPGYAPAARPVRVPAAPPCFPSSAGSLRRLSDPVGVAVLTEGPPKW